MKINGHGVIFDPKKNKVVARFVGGELETDDARIIELATMAGFVERKTDTDIAQEDDWNPTKDELLEIADRHGVDVDKRWGVERLKAAVLQEDGNG
jgi:hypothetical protein